ncbi:hypothetical protein C5167_044440 [Papaver somniferum]|uniref:Uncharacterized protein n=1 Tax=Papaver somniferum TaxID=3469 RepID=A0A4Y7L8J8_PAPSO|nr:hypothetical protein C5167_044440 [Papaver somniferum]
MFDKTPEQPAKFHQLYNELLGLSNGSDKVVRMRILHHTVVVLQVTKMRQWWSEKSDNGSSDTRGSGREGSQGGYDGGYGGSSGAGNSGCGYDGGSADLK